MTKLIQSIKIGLPTAILLLGIAVFGQSAPTDAPPTKAQNFRITGTLTVDELTSAIPKTNGSGVFSEAVAGTDYLAPAAIGTTVQAYDADLTTYAGITPAANVQSLLGAADYSAMRTQLSLVPGTNISPVGVIVVKANDGSEATYTTLSAAKAGAASGSTARVYPGSYSHNATLSKSGVNWQIEQGAVVSVTGSANAFDSTGDNESFTVVCNGRVNAANGHVFSCTHSGAEIIVRGNDFHSDANTIAYASAGTVTLDIRLADTTNYDTFWSDGGTLRGHCQIIQAGSNGFESTNGGSIFMTFGIGISVDEFVLLDSDGQGTVHITGEDATTSTSIISVFSDSGCADARIAIKKANGRVIHSGGVMRIAGGYYGQSTGTAATCRVTADGLTLDNVTLDAPSGASEVIDTNGSTPAVTIVGSLGNPDSLAIDTSAVVSYPAASSMVAQIKAAGGISNAAYGSGWDGDPNAPSKDAVYDKIEALSVGSGSPGGSDTYVQFNDGGSFGGDSGFTYNKTTDIATLAGGIVIGSSNPFSDSAGTLTLQNVDALDATTESTVEAAIDTLANLTSIQGKTVTLTGDFIRSGSHSLTLTTTGATNLTLPTAFGTGVVNALGTNVGSAGGFVTNGGDLGTPATGDLPNCTGLLSIVVGNEATDTTCFMVFTKSATGELPLKTNTSVTLNSNTGALSSTSLLEGANAVPNATDHLGFFASTTSAQLAGVLSDENGTGKIIFSAGTLDIASGKTLTASNTLTFTGTDSSTVAFGGGGTVLYTSGIGSSVQGYDADLTTWAGITPGTNVGTALAVSLNNATGGLITADGSATLTNKTIGVGQLSGQVAAAKGGTGQDFSGASGIIKVASGTFSAVTAPSGTIVGTSDTQTLTNKRNTKRVVSVSYNANPTINTDNGDAFNISLTGNVTSFTTNLSGTPNDEDRMVWNISSDSSGPYTISAYGSSFQASGSVSLPTTMPASKIVKLLWIYSAAKSKWVLYASDPTGI